MNRHQRRAQKSAMPKSVTWFKYDDLISIYEPTQRTMTSNTTINIDEYFYMIHKEHCKNNVGVDAYIVSMKTTMGHQALIIYYRPTNSFRVLQHDMVAMIESLPDLSTASIPDTLIDEQVKSLVANARAANGKTINPTAPKMRW